MSELEQYLRNDKFAQHIEVELLEAAGGSATARLVIQEHHLNSHGTVHGGVLFSLADAVFAAASNSHGVQAFAINANISFLKAVTAGTLTARAKEVSLNPTLAVYDVEITSDTGELVAVFQGMVYRKKKRVDGQGDGEKA